jgi:serine/threonine protein kinase
MEVFMRFKFLNGHMFNKGEPVKLTGKILRDGKGEKYVAHCPPQYEVLRFFDMGRSWRVTEVRCLKTCSTYLLKNLIDEENFNECYAITNLQGALLKHYRGKAVRIPNVIEAGYTERGANYVIEEKMEGGYTLPSRIKSLPADARMAFAKNMGAFLFSLHRSFAAARFVDALPPNSNPQETYMDGHHFVRLIYQNYKVGWPLSIIHGDLGPRNVLIDDGGNISVIDWGRTRLDNAFAEFDAAYHYPHGFGSAILDEISDEYCTLREKEYVAMQRSKNPSRGTKPTDKNPHSRLLSLNYRLPKYLRGNLKEKRR